ncbi:MAG: SDR family oxidoreductase [Kiritimatiellaeota bacterium]|nr:SDR family oxidoreductase [Kiritimatiellota bacterium]
MKKTTDSLTCNTALVSGAGRGIGRAIALALAREGMRLALTARSRDQLEQTAARIRADTGRNALVLPCDLRKPAEIADLAREVSDAFAGCVDVLVNNAGVFFEAPVEETALEQWDAVFEVNLTAPFLLTRAFLPRMKSRRRGWIVNVASTSALSGYLHQAAYCAAKHGLLGFSRSLALECRPRGVRVHAVCPGGVDTDFIAGSHVAERIKGQAVLEPENIADLVVFLLRQPPNVDYPEVVVKRFQD